MGPSHEGNDPLKTLRDMAEDNGLGGRKLLIEKEGPDFFRGLRAVVQELMGEEFVGPEEVKKLHPEIDDELAKSLAASISLTLLTRRIQNLREGPSPIGPADLQQVIAGTSVATSEGLASVAMGLGTTSREIIEEARVRAMLPEEE